MICSSKNNAYICGRLLTYLYEIIGMNNSFFSKMALFVFAIIQTNYTVASDYSGRHYSDNNSDSGLGFIVLSAVVLGAIFLIGAIKSNYNNRTDSTHTNISHNKNTAHSFKDSELQNRLDYIRHIEHLKKQAEEAEKEKKQWIWTIIVLIIIFIGSFIKWGIK